MSRFPSAIVAAFLGALSPAPCLASYSSIQLNMLDSVVDTTFDASTGVMRVFSDSSDFLFLNDSEPLDGTITNTVFDFEVTLDHVVADPIWAISEAVFGDGHFLLTFDYDDGFGAQSYFIGGPVESMSFFVTDLNPVSRIGSEAFLLPVTGDLPGSSDFGSPFGDLQMLSLIFVDLSGWNWDENIEGQTQIVLFPSKIPEPGALVFLIVGGVFFGRRSR